MRIYNMKSKMNERRTALPDLPLTELTTISPPDGRYRPRVKELAHFTSEYGLIKARFEVEAKYLIALSSAGVIRPLTGREKDQLTNLGDTIDLTVAGRVKEIESETRHDVKAMERAFREMVAGTSLEEIVEMIHFGLTSEDVNNLAYRLMLKRAVNRVIIPTLDQITDELVQRAEKYKSLPMLARTHGQPAVPTTLGKEIAVFASRLNTQVRKLEDQKFTGKITGTVGNFNALHFAYPDIDWPAFSAKFVKSLGFESNPVTTQINQYEDIIEYFQTLYRINGIILNLDQDFWRYISDDWFIQAIIEGEVGSSIMPHKANPIDFENSEGNIAIGDGIIEAMARKLRVSRLQRDLSDSTVIRNEGLVLAYALIAQKSVLEGLSRVSPNEPTIAEALNKNWIILTEAVQTVLRKAGSKDPYSLIASLARGRHVGQEEWQAWVNKLPVEEEQKTHLRELSPQTYLGLAKEITVKATRKIKASRKR